jgi:GT2 family glycosyltransferase
LATVSAVVVAHQGGERVLACLRALERQTRPLLEILLIDNASTDGTGERVRECFPAVQVIRLPDNPGPGAARNRGLALARGELVLWIDHDLYLEPDAVERMLAAKERMPAEVVLPRIRLHPEREIVQCDGGAPHVVGTLLLRHGFTPLAAIARNEPTYVEAAPSGCMLVEKRVIEAAGGFDESFFFYLEDLELSLRLRLFGARILCEPAAVAFHDRGTGSRLAFRGAGPYPCERAYLLMRNRLRIVATHYAAGTILALLPTLLVYEAASAAISLLRGWGGAWLDAWRWVIANRREILARRRWIQARRRVADGAILQGGPLPIAPGLLRTTVERRVVEALGLFVAANWRLARRLV